MASLCSWTAYTVTICTMVNGKIKLSTYRSGLTLACMQMQDGWTECGSTTWSTSSCTSTSTSATSGFSSGLSRLLPPKTPRMTCSGFHSSPRIRMMMLSWARRSRSRKPKYGCDWPTRWLAPTGSRASGSTWTSTWCSLPLLWLSLFWTSHCFPSGTSSSVCC